MVCGPAYVPLSLIKLWGVAGHTPILGAVEVRPAILSASSSRPQTSPSIPYSHLRWARLALRAPEKIMGSSPREGSTCRTWEPEAQSLSPTRTHTHIPPPPACRPACGHNTVDYKPCTKINLPHAINLRAVCSAIFAR